MTSLQDLSKSLTSSQLFQDWLKLHPQAYLSHFFTSLTLQFKQKSSWEIGYYNPSNNKISIFLPTKQNFMFKQEDDIFQKEINPLEELNLTKVKISLSQICIKMQKNLSQMFPQEILGDGFVVVQTFNGKTQWNFSFVTKSLKFANLRVSADSGQVDSHQLVEAVRME